MVDYLPALDLTVAVREGFAAGFSGLENGKMEVLFVDDVHRGRGVGSALLRDAINRFPGLLLDVNERNRQALAFYEAHGFVITGRSDTDADGRPFPLLHLAHITPSR
ncbi:GNAT family N-acetyltransferase [Rhodococcus opacus]|uniref:GNAT family N-acetyltransferase n=1 Tax=Rhodococcus opacus TaxID=37919 RepID=UPI000A7247E3|nr:GNAT family N-acetyltransferase [Rhodococcus opacus]